MTPNSNFPFRSVRLGLAFFFILFMAVASWAADGSKIYKSSVQDKSRLSIGGYQVSQGGSWSSKTPVIFTADDIQIQTANSLGHDGNYICLNNQKGSFYKDFDFTISSPNETKYIKRVTIHYLHKTGSTEYTASATAASATGPNVHTLTASVSVERQTEYRLLSFEVEFTDEPYYSVKPAEGLEIVNTDDACLVDTWHNGYTGVTTTTYYFHPNTSITIAPTSAVQVITKVTTPTTGATTASDKRSFSFAMPASDITPSATLEEAHSVALTGNVSISEPFFTYDGDNYYKFGDKITITATKTNEIISGITGIADYTIADDKKSATFTMPTSDLALAVTTFEVRVAVPYIDENGKEKSVTKCILLTSAIDVSNLPGGWYVVQGDVNYKSQVTFDGDVSLILADDAKMKVEIEGESEHGINTNGNLTIYGQSGQNGILKATAKGSYGYGIYSSGNVTISGGNVIASSENNRGISGNGNITISGGTVTATGNSEGIYSNRKVAINGGSVTATSENGNGIYDYLGVAINGGSVTATSENGNGVFTYNGNIALSWTNPTDNIKVSSYFIMPDYVVVIADGKAFMDEDGNVYNGTLNVDQYSAIEGKTLTPCYAVAFDLQDGKDPVMRPATFDKNGVAHVAKPADPTRDGYSFLGWFTTKDGDTEFDFDAAITVNNTATYAWSSSSFSSSSSSSFSSSSAAITGNTITVYAKWQKNAPIEYIDENGKSQYTTVYTVLTSTTDVSNLPGGWYVVLGEVRYESTVKFGGDAHLILADGAKMEIETEGESEHGIYASNNLTIYGQNEQSGILKVTATGNDGIFSWSDITIIGGSVTATSKNGYGIYGYKGVTISGGTVEATGTGGDGIYSYSGDITLGWTNSTDFIKASSYSLGVNEKHVSIAEGKSFKDEKGYVYRGTLNAGQLSSLKGQKIEPFEGVSVSFVDNFSEASEVIAEIAVDGEDHVSAPSKHPFHSGYAFVGWFAAPEGGSEFDFTKAVTGNTTAYAHWNENTPVEYIDENGETNETKNYILLTNDINVDNLPGGWYVVQGKVEYTSQVKFEDDAHLILADGAEMEIETESKYGIYASKNLTIYGQNGQSGILNATANGTNGYGIYSRGNITIIGGSVAATGKNGYGIYSGNGSITISGGTVTVTGDNNGIYSSNGSITISGGTVEATGKNGYGIHGDNGVTINGGSVTATGTNGPGILCFNGVTINGGSVTATGNDYGIYSNSGDITIIGGSVTATGGYYGIYGYKGVTISGGTVTATGTNGPGIYSVSGDITLGWTNSTDFIYASRYYSENGSVKIAKGKSLKDEKGIVYRGSLTDENLEYIKNKTLVPLSFKGKFLSDVNIAVADIPVQKYADGKPVCPSVVVTEGKDTLTAGSDYTVTCFNNTAVSSATLDEAAIAQITGKGNYAGAIQKRFFIWNNIRDYAAVQVYKDADEKVHAEIDGTYDGADAVAIDKDIAVNDVVFNRKFTPNSGHATIMFPFDVNASSLTGVRSVIEFDGVKTDKNDNKMVGMRYVWCNATLGEQEELNKHPNCNKYSGELKAYTPYMIEMDSPTLGIKDAVTLKSNSGKIVGDAPVGNWVFRGTLQKKEWPKGTGIINEGRLWAFSAAERSGAKIGEFVQFGGNNWANPFRAYLVECKKTDNGLDCSDDDSGTQPKASQVSRYRFADVLAPASSAENSLSAKKPMGVAASETASLNSMDIVIVYGDKDSVGGKEHTTVIGRMNPATGEIRMLPRTKQTYDLKGRRVGNGKKAKGAYYNRR